MTSRSIEQKGAVFRALHESGCFVLPNPWDIGSARALEKMGFKALASTSSGHAWSNGKPDGGMSRDDVLHHLRYMVGATDLPVNADFESGFGETPDALAESIALAIETGVAGLSLEDSTHDTASPLMPIELATERMRIARQVIDDSGADVVLVGRAENFFAGMPDLDDAIKRLQAYAEAGADCLYAPGIRTREQIAAVVRAVAPKPVNVLIGWPSDLTVSELAEMGVRRISVGGALARAAWGGFAAAARSIAEEGRFDGFNSALPGAELNELFRS